MGDWRTNQWNNGIEQGRHHVQFVSGKGEILDIERVVLLASGAPLFLVTTDGTKYNYSNVIFTKKLETQDV